MDRPEWHSKLIHIALTVALVLSLIGIAVLPPVLSPVLANPGPDLGVTVTTEKVRYLEGVYCVCDNFTVNATITNSGDVTAQNVTANITWAPLSGASLVAGTASQFVGNVTNSTPQIVQWTLHCDEQGALNITVDVEEVLAAAQGDSASNWTEVNQREIGSDLTVTIFSPPEGSEFGVCTNFTLTFNITNTGNITAYNVNARIDPSSGVNGYDIHGDPYSPGQSFSTSTIASLAPGASHQWSVPMHCAGCDEYGYLSSIHVMPMGEGGCTGTEIQSEYLHSDIVHFYQKYGVTCDAEPNPTKVCHNVTFTVTLGECAEYPVSWNWTFGDGNSTADTASSSPFTTTHHYNASDNYTAVVNVVDNLGITGTCNVTVEVFPPLTANCTVSGNITRGNITKVCHSVTFNGTGIGGFPEWPALDGCNYTWEWDFDDEADPATGDGKTSGNVPHCYNATGNYTAVFTVRDNCALNNTATCNVTVEVFPPLSANCTVTPNSTKVGDNVTFTGTGVDGLPYPDVCDSYNWTWDFDDGSSQTGSGYTSGPVSHGYAEGNYTAVFTIQDNCLNNTATCNVTVEVFPSLNVTCGVEPERARVCNAVNFTAERVGGVEGHNYTWYWNFGDGSNSTEQNPTHTYMCVGNWSANVTLTDAELGNNATCNVTVEVYIEPPELIYPPNMSQLTSKNVTFEWEDIGCCNYTLEVWQKDGARVLEVDTGKVSHYTWCIFDGNWKWFVTATDSCNITATSATSYFQMDAPEPSVTVQDPNGGETLVCNSIKSITWTATPTDATIEILYSSDGGGTWTQIASGEVNDGAYPWTVPCINSDLCLVKVIARDACQGEGADTSDGAFTITTATLVSIADVGVSVNGTINATIQIKGVTDLAAADIWLSYNNSVVEVSNVTAGDLGTITVAIDNPNGVTKMNRFSATGNTGDFILAYVTLQAVGSAGDTSPLDLDVKALVDADGDPITHATEDGVFTILSLMEGDVTLNGCVSIADAMFIAQYAFGLRTLNADQLTCADTNDSGSVTLADAMHVAQWLVDPNGSLGVLLQPLWQSPADDSMLVPLAC